MKVPSTKTCIITGVAGENPDDCTTHGHEDSDMVPHLVITGNPVDGFFYYGPFDDAQDAADWANENQDGVDWWIAKLADPTAEEIGG